MWFKNIHFFEFEKPVTYQAEQLAEKLATMPFLPCGKNMPLSMGWTSPMLDSDGPLVYTANGCLLFCLKIEEKLLPAFVVNHHVSEQVKYIEETQGVKPSRAQRQALKEEMIQTLLPRAFSKYTHIYGYIDTKNQWLLVDTSSPAKCDKFTTYLRKTLSTLPIVSPEITGVKTVMTGWLDLENYPEDLTVEDTCVMKTPSEEAASVRFQRQDLFSDRVGSFVKQGHFITQIALSWREQLRFVLTDELVFKQIKFLEGVQETVMEAVDENKLDAFDADFVIMTETFEAFLKQMLSLFSADVKKSVKKEIKERHYETA